MTHSELKLSFIENLILAILGTLTVILVLCACFLIIRKIRCNDRFTLFTLISLNLGLISYTIFCGLNVWQYGGDCIFDLDQDLRFQLISTTLPVFFMALSLISNFRNWIYFYLRINIRRQNHHKTAEYIM